MSPSASATCSAVRSSNALVELGLALGRREHPPGPVHGVAGARPSAHLASSARRWLRVRATTADPAGAAGVMAAGVGASPSGVSPLRPAAARARARAWSATAAAPTAAPAASTFVPLRSTARTLLRGRRPLAAGPTARRYQPW